MKTFVKDFPSFKKFFNFQEFNQVQNRCYKPLMNDRCNMVVSAPTSSGKTVIFQLAIINQIKNGCVRCLYLAPIKSLCHQKSTHWNSKFREKLRIFQLTSDTSAQQQNAQELQEVNLVIATPQKIDAFSRKNLTFLSKINLLLVDEVHMLNYEDRGATLQAVISRIMSISNPRIIAVSATIPNIKEVAEWLRASQDMTFLFGQEYRPVKLNKIVLGFKSSNNPYTFEKMLNYKLTQVIRSYSQYKGVLVFCQTQKGTQMACQQIITDMKQREFIGDDQTLMALIRGSKTVSNNTLQIMIPQGVAFHNAGLSLQDRSMVQKLFLQNHLRILCTTSTLAMGINLPARLVVIKSTQCYRGSGKGYQQYTQIQIDQMMGRAGRPPFDKEGTVVIMTQKQNYNKYLNSGKLEVLQSHLYRQLCEHINAEISLKSIKSFNDVLKYFMNSFCYVRMKNSPGSYGIKDKTQNHVQKICLQSITKLNNYNFIKYCPENQSIIPKQLGINVARNSIQIQTIITIIKQISKIKSERDYLSILCESEQIKKYRNKLDERKLLKEINDKNRYVLKQAISNAEKKCYVLLQCELDGRHIQNWQLRKQAKDMIYFLRRLTYCVNTVCYDLKLFWPYYWSCVQNKNFSLRFWERNQQMVIRQFPQFNDKWKMLSAKGFKNIDHIMNNLQHLDTICQKNSQFSQMMSRKIENLRESIMIKLTKSDPQREKNQNQQYRNQIMQLSQEENHLFQRNYPGKKDILIQIQFNGFFDEIFKSISIIVGQGTELYTIRTLKKQCNQTTIAVSSSKCYSIGVVKSNYIGFDQFYQVIGGKNIKKVDNVSSFIDMESTDRLNKGNKQKERQKQRQAQKQKQKYRSQEKNNRKASVGKISSNKIQNSVIEEKQKKIKKRGRSSQWICTKKSSKNNDSFEEQTRNKKNISMLNNQNAHKYNSRKKPLDYIEQEEEMTIKPGTYIPLNQYKCWKPGFRKFEETGENRLTVNKNLMILDEDSSKSKASLQSNSLQTVKSKSQIHWSRYAYREPINHIKQERQQKNNSENKMAKKEQITSSNPYDYFMNLFDK